MDKLAAIFHKNRFAVILAASLSLLCIALIFLIVILVTAVKEKEGCSVDNLGAISRSEWGALPPDQSLTGEQGFYNLVSNPGGWLTYEAPLRVVLDTIVVHHTALPLSDGPLEIQQLHMQERGCADIGYHFVIDAQGRIYEGRAINVRGAHTGGQNYGKIGIVLMGNFEVDEPSEAQLNSLTALSRCLVQEYAIERIAGHRDFQPGETLCPGKNLWPRLPALAEMLER